MIFLCSSLCVIDFDSQNQPSMQNQHNNPSPVETNDEIVTENDLRKKRLAARDVVYTVDLIQLFRHEVNNLRMRVGEANFTELLSTVDVETMQLAKTYLE